MSEIVWPTSWTPRSVSAIHKALLKWFDQERRDLPWRADRDPYRIWVSEVMLQQTTVSAVIPFFDRFMNAFPTITELAAADEQEVLRLWAGLGYYRRARHLHQAAKRLVEEHGTQLPNDPEVWTLLPGVGRYILGAVLSQAFDQRLPIVEANSQRVISRLFGFRENPREGPGKRWIWAAAESLLPKKRVGDFNQGLMELGALICTPTTPHCEICPVARFCEAKRQGAQNEIPPRPTSPNSTRVREVAVIIRKQNTILLCQRPADANRWANFWEVPHGELQTGESEEHAVRRIAHELTGITVEAGTCLTTINHTVTRWSITMHCFESEHRSGRFQSGFYSQSDWVDPKKLAEFPMSSPQRKLMEKLRGTSRQLRLF